MSASSTSEPWTESAASLSKEVEIYLAAVPQAAEDGAKQLENVYEYLSLNRSRIEIINVLEKLESEDTKINKAKTDLEKFSET